MLTARRYLTIIQDPRGYPGPGAELDPAPPDGPEPPVLHSVVLADDFERVEAEVERLRAALADAAEHLRLAWTWTADTERHEKLRWARKRATLALSDTAATPDGPGRGGNDG